MGVRCSKFRSNINYRRPEDDSDSDSEAVELGGGKVQVIKNVEAWDEKLLEAERLHKIVIVNFSAKWCGPCKIIAPYYRELSKKYPSLMFLVIDVDEMPELGRSWDIKATPTFFFLKGGQTIDKFIGANKSELMKIITKTAEKFPSKTYSH